MSRHTSEQKGYIVEILNARKYYPGIQALKGVDFALEKGEIHSLVGENGSGKSTLIKIISGVIAPEEGTTLIVDQEPVERLRAHDAIAHGIRVIYQDLSLFPNLTIKENIAFQVMRARDQRWVKWKKLKEIAASAFQELGIGHIDVELTVESLSIAEQQLVEIARALIGNVRLLILDEPTASLTRKEVDALFAVIGRMQKRGITILFVSHKLNEVFDIAERVTVVRDGEKIGCYHPQELDQEKLTYLMTGQKIVKQPPDALTKKTPLLELRTLSKRNAYRDISLTLHKGEILGITGLLGSGRSELAQSIFGMTLPDSGDILLEGKKWRPRSSSYALKTGIGYVPENRIVEGIIAAQPIVYNSTITVWDRIRDRYGLLAADELREVSEKWIENLDIKIDTIYSAINTLSGGNQQKVVLAKWLASDPKILILDEPTVGIDVYAKESVHRIIKSLAARGIGVIIISDEIPEVLHNCHRILIMRRGRIVYECDAHEVAADELLAKCSAE